MATAMCRSFIRARGVINKGVKSAGFYVLRHTRTAADLVEPVFTSNEDPQAKAPLAISEGIIRYLANSS